MKNTIRKVLYRILKISWVGIILIMWTDSFSQNLSALYGYSRFRPTDSINEYEYYIRIPSGAVNFVTTPANKIQAMVYCEVDISLEGTDSVVYKDRFNLVSPEVDSVVTFRHFNAQRRAYLPPGKYEVKVKVKDANTSNEAIVMNDDFKLDFPEDKISLSDIQLLDSYSKSDVKDMFYRNGFTLKTHNTSFYPPIEDRIKYFFELYNVTKSIPEGEDFLLVMGIEQADTYKRITNFGGFKKMKSGDNLARLAEIGIESLPSGNYNFFVEVRNKENQLLTLRRKYFQRSNPMKDNLDNISVNQTFASKLDLETIKFYSAAFRPIASEEEKRNIELILGTDDTTMARSFVYSFWHKRYPGNPEYYYKTYQNMVDYTDNELSSSKRRGYSTAMGRVYLKYGPPNKIENERNDPQRDVQGTTTPYQIWYYYNIAETNQTNRLFVFVNRSKVGHNYEMIHSNVRGENYIDDWLGHMRWKALLHNYTGTERIDISRDDNRFNNEQFGTPGHWDQR